MQAFNKVILAGNVTRDIEMRYMPNGKAVADIGLALNHTWTGEDGAKHEECSFVDCTAFGRPAEVLAQYLKKGNPVLFEGRLRQETWDDKQTNQKRSKLKVIIEGWTFLPNGQRQAGEAAQPAAPGTAKKSFAEMRQAAGAAANAGTQPPDPEDDVPF